jgi:hypothetical protein
MVLDENGTAVSTDKRWYATLTTIDHFLSDFSLGLRKPTARKVLVVMRTKTTTRKMRKSPKNPKKSPKRRRRPVLQAVHLRNQSSLVPKGVS